MRRPSDMAFKQSFVLHLPGVVALTQMAACWLQAALLVDSSEEEREAAAAAAALAQEVLEGALRGNAIVRLCACLEDCAASPAAPGAWCWHPPVLWRCPST